MNVFDYFVQVFGVEPKHNSGTIFLMDYLVDTETGKKAVEIIDKGKQLLELCDVCVTENIKQAVTLAVETVCFG